jgi:cyclic pyranopterin phosphate synthase
MPADGVPKVAHSDLLSLEGLADLVRWLAVHVGISRVRLTGGEPLVRPGIEHLITELAVLPQIEEVSLTTNGSLLQRMAATLKAAGLKRVNVSLDSLDEQRFAEVTRGGNLKQTLAGIQTARDVGLAPIKLNTVLRRSTWKQEVPLLLDYAASNGYEIRFIELMRTGTERQWCESELISVGEVCRELGAEIISEEQTRVPAQKTVMNWRGAPLTVGWITPRSHPFCQFCERLRMDARGRVRRCLMDPAMLDLASVVGTMDGKAAVQEFQSYLAGKVRPKDMDSPLSMSQIGG